MVTRLHLSVCLESQPPTEAHELLPLEAVERIGMQQDLVVLATTAAAAASAAAASAATTPRTILHDKILSVLADVGFTGLCPSCVLRRCRRFFPSCRLLLFVLSGRASGAVL